MYICLCKGITDSTIRKLGRCGIVGEHDLIEVLGLKDQECCGRCIQAITEITALAQSDVITQVKPRLCPGVASDSEADRDRMA